MPVYVFPDLLAGVPDALKKRMQGKSCFNVPSLATLEGEPAVALERLTAAGYDRYRRAGLIEDNPAARP